MFIIMKKIPRSSESTGTVISPVVTQYIISPFRGLFNLLRPRIVEFISIGIYESLILWLGEGREE